MERVALSKDVGLQLLGNTLPAFRLRLSC